MEEDKGRAATSRDSEKYIVRFPEGMRDQIASAAAQNHRTINAEIVARLQRTFDQDRAAEEAVASLNKTLVDLTEQFNRLNRRLDSGEPLAAPKRSPKRPKS